MHTHHNGLKTAALFGGMWAILLGIGWMVAAYLNSSVTQGEGQDVARAALSGHRLVLPVEGGRFQSGVGGQQSGLKPYRWPSATH